MMARNNSNFTGIVNSNSTQGMVLGNINERRSPK
jgi:hypothetical protein